jgi:hypothetical protein
VRVSDDIGAVVELRAGEKERRYEGRFIGFHTRDVEEDYEVVGTELHLWVDGAGSSGTPVSTTLTFTFTAHEQWDDFIDDLRLAAHRRWAQLPWLDTDPIYVVTATNPAKEFKRHLDALVEASEASLALLRRIRDHGPESDAADELWPKYDLLRRDEDHRFDTLRDFPRFASTATQKEYIFGGVRGWKAAEEWLLSDDDDE